MSAAKRARCRPRGERGSTAVEFALVFPLLFAVFYGVATFSLIFVAKQSLTLAAEEGARAALNYQSASNTQAALAARGQSACTVASNAAAWLGGGSRCAAEAQPCSYDASMDCISVTLTYDYAARPLVPALPLLDIALPGTLTSAAVVQINPENVL
ncbi:TadE family protein [Trinickia caryophylli]|uniref:TadE-like protein n=1 Tax=Trinickia caryophylli TaxID=28094 RepID=A0A1X7GAE5_TRICW|nr:TadE family protein [Trinickia caryophylli]PMS11385.1 pilus assembly protein [Trinickia caryophylli]TRX17580.1 pilus assembly protein [Trinickia caryophylli]WQE11668.1 TadE family protein [Trinickia caryophylli]SMF66280.1 TadE-like protein [Trinickia caryophylli]GLU34854.1 hypothetical protein Busp01_46960 [Trinickia caryophylli]